MSKDERARRQRIRDSILNFYEVEAPPKAANVTEEAAAAQAEATKAKAASSATASDMNIDSANFDVQKYTTALLRQLTLPKLIEQDDALRTQVKDLDNQLQDLVYGNYAKFIAAADTVRQVRSNVQDMGSRLDSLSTNVESMDEVSRGITENLHSHREKIDQMLSVNNMLRKIQFLIKLPEAIQNAMNQQRYSAAVKCWVAGDAVFVKYSHVASFQKTHSESRAIAERLYITLSEEISNASLSGDSTAQDATRSMVESMRLLYTTSISTKALKLGGAVVGNRPEPFGPDGEINTVHIDVSEFDAAMCSIQLEAITKRFEEALRDFKGQVKAEFTSRQDVVAGAMRCGFDSSAAADVKLRKMSLAPQLSLLRNACDQLTSETRRLYDQLGRAAPKDLQHKSLALIQPAVVEALDLISTEAVEWVKDAIVESARILAVGARQLPPKHNPVADNMFASCTALLDAIVALLIDVSNRFSALSAEFLRSAGTDNSTGFNVQVDKFCLKLVADCLELFKSVKEDQVDHPDPVLVMSIMCKQFGRHALADIVDADVAKIRDTKALQSEFDDVSKRLVNVFVAVSGMNGTEKFLEATNIGSSSSSVWGNLSEGPTSASSAFKALVTYCDETARFVGHTFLTQKAAAKAQHTVHSGGSGTGSRTSGDAGSHRGPGSAASARSQLVVPNILAQFNRRDASRGGGLASDVERLFSKQPTALSLRPLTLDAQHISECVIISCLKGVLETVRQTPSFNRNAFHQLQIDTTYFLLSLNDSHVAAVSPWFRKANKVVALVNEVLTCAYERCRERVPMVASAVEEVAKGARQQQ